MARNNDKKVRAKLYIAGRLPFEFNFARIIHHKSTLFTVDRIIKYIKIEENPDSAAAHSPNAITREELKKPKKIFNG